MDVIEANRDRIIMPTTYASQLQNAQSMTLYGFTASMTSLVPPEPTDPPSTMNI
jgi:hypothetical protein